jgi:pyridoxamine 5'-phosphate oxidase family protein
MAFTEKEIAYLSQQRLGRLATVGPDGNPHNVPVGFRFDAELGTLDITGRGLSRSRKYRDVRKNPAIALVVDDVPSTDPWIARGIEIRGMAEALAEGGRAIAAHLDDEMIRVRPTRIIAWGIDAGWQAGPNARDVPW